MKNWFLKSSSFVNWNGPNSELFPLLSGVRQGGILSPLLVSLYVNTVLEKLESSQLGCFVNFNCYNSFMYADDIILISNSVTDLQLMLNMCCDIFNELDLPINVNKCHCIRIGPMYRSQCYKLTIQETEVDWVNKIRFLGVYLISGKNLQFCWKEAKCKFYRTVNSILGRIGCSPINVILSLVKAQALPLLLYGISAATLSKSDMSSLSFAYNSIFVKLFNIKESETIRQCQFYSGYLTFNCLYDYYRLGFINNLLKTNKIKCDNSIDLPDIFEYERLGIQYGICNTDSISIMKNKIWKSFRN